MIDLNKYVGQRSGRVHVLSGKERGLDVRKALELDRLDNGGETTTIEVPHDLHRMTPSFILGLFSKTLEQMAKSDRTIDQVRVLFFQKYEFVTKGKPAERIRGQVQESITDFFSSKSSLQDFISGFGQKKV
jgi:hypothetical protein